VIEKMLQRMFIGDPPGAYDRLLDFSTPHTGTTFFTHPRHAANAGPGVTKSRCIDECTPWREPLNLEGSADGCFGSHNGLKSDIAPCLKNAKSGPDVRSRRCINNRLTLTAAQIAY
jgi:hypothetical protein